MAKEQLKPLQWRTYEYEEIHRPTDWFIAVAIITITLAVASVLIDNLLFAVVIVISSIALVLNAIKKPLLLDYEISMEGVTAGTYKYPYSELHSFWIKEEEDIVLIRQKRITATLISIPVKDVPMETVRQFLTIYLPQEEILEPLSQKIMERLGF